MSVRGLALVVVCACLAAACGGGGGGGKKPPSSSAPTMAAQTFNGDEDTVLTGKVAASGDSLTFTVTTPAANGVVNLAAGGGFTYTPNQNFSGNDTFIVRVQDSRGRAATATMTLVLAAVNDAPVAANDVFTVTSADALEVLANDSDVDDDTLTVTLVGGAFAGTATVTGNTVQVALPEGFKGFTKFTYRVTDGSGATADASALVFVGIEPFKVVNFRYSDDAAEKGFYVHDLFEERRATEVNAVGIHNFDSVRFAAGGGALVYLGINTDTNLTELRYLDLTDPAAQTRVVNEPRSGYPVSEYAISRDGRYVAYAVSSIGLGSWIELFDAEAAGFGTRLSLPADAQLTAGQVQFNDAGSIVYYNGCEPPSGIDFVCSLHRASVVSRDVERVSPAMPGASATLLSPVTRDDDHIVFQRVIIPENAPWEYPVMMSRAGQPDVATPLGNIGADEISMFPMGLFADGSRAFISIASEGAPLRSVVASLTDPDDVITIGGSGVWQGDIHLPGGLRRDSGAVLYHRCAAGSCQVYETRLDDPDTSVPIGVPVAVTNSSYWQAQYSADGERMIYLREETLPSPFRRVVEVTRRDAPGETIHVTPNDGVAHVFELDASGRVVAASMQDDVVGARMTLTNVDLPLVSMDLGPDAARYQTHAVLPR